MQGDGLAGGGGVFAGGSHVVLHIAAAEGAAWVDVFKLREDLGWSAADGVGHDVEAAAVRHCDEGAGYSGCGGGGEDLIEKWNEDGEAFERESLGAEIALLDYLREDISADE